MAELKKVTAHFIPEEKREQTDYGSLTNVLCEPVAELVYVGTASKVNDIFHVFDPETQKFHSLGYGKTAEKHEVKLHRSLILDEGVIYGATAWLLDYTEAHKESGGWIFKYELADNRIEKIAIPCAHTGRYPDDYDGPQEKNHLWTNLSILVRLQIRFDGRTSKDSGNASRISPLAGS